MTDKECAEKVKEIGKKYHDDEEMCHIEADDELCYILRRLGFIETVKAFDELPKWYS